MLYYYYLTIYLVLVRAELLNGYFSPVWFNVTVSERKDMGILYALGNARNKFKMC